jgi:hypothetical protein
MHLDLHANCQILTKTGVHILLKFSHMICDEIPFSGVLVMWSVQIDRLNRDTKPYEMFTYL